MTANAENDQLRATLQQLLQVHGTDLLDSQLRLEGLLRDECPEPVREVNVLLATLRVGIPAELLSMPDTQFEEVVVHRWIQRLDKSVGMSTNSAQWAISLWAEVLGKSLKNGLSQNPSPNLHSGMQSGSQGGAPTPSISTPLKQSSTNTPPSSPTTPGGKQASFSRSRSTLIATAQPTSTAVGPANSTTSRTPPRAARWRLPLVLLSAALLALVYIKFSAQSIPSAAKGKISAPATVSSSRPAAGTEARRLATAAQERNDSVVDDLLRLRQRQSQGLLTEEEIHASRLKLGNQLRQARDFSNKAVASDPGNRQAWLQRVRAHYYLGEYPTAQQFAREANKRFPGDSDLLQLQSLVDSKLKNNQRG